MQSSIKSMFEHMSKENKNSEDVIGVKPREDTAVKENVGQVLSTISNNGEPEDCEMPWDDEDFIPRTKSGKQKSPNQIRNELRRYIEASSENQTAIIKRMGVNSNSFGRFMNPKNYKNMWSAVDNGTYWAAARLLEEDSYLKEQAKKTDKGAKKRMLEGEPGGGGGGGKKAKRQEVEAMMATINAITEVSDDSPIFDSCPDLVKKINAFLAEDGVTKAAFCRALGGINQNSLQPFLMGKKQDQCGNVTYKRAYVFFEKKRIMEGVPKTAKRKKNENEQPDGFSERRPPTHVWVYMGR